VRPDAETSATKPPLLSGRRRLVAFCVLLGLTVTAGTLAVCGGGGSGPAMEFVGGETVDFGRVLEPPPEGTLERTVLLRNSSGAPVEVTGIRTTCSCAAAAAEERTIPAGGATKIHIRLDFRPTKGLQEYKVFVMTDHPDAGVLTLPVRYQYAGGWVAEPSTLALRDARRGRRYERSVIIRSRPGIPELEIEDVSSSSESVRVKGYERVGVQDGRVVWRVNVEVVPADRLYEKCHLTVDDGVIAEGPEAQIPVVINTLRPLVAEPGALVVERELGESPSWREVAIHAPDGRALRPEVSVSDDRLEWELVRETRDFSRATLRVLARKTAGPAFFGAKVFVEPAPSVSGNRLVIPVLVRVD